MKRTLLFLAVFFMTVSMTLTSCTAEEVRKDLKADSKENVEIILQIGNPIMTVNGEEKEIDSGEETFPVIVNERTLLPIRAVVEAMGGEVLWDEQLKLVTLTYGNDVVKLTIDSTEAFLNDSAQELDVAPQIINNRTMLPIRFVAESFKFNVEWNGEEQKITLSNKKVNSEADDTQPAVPATDEKNTEKVLVVYFSNTGNTKALAEKIQSVTGGDIEEILPSVPYTSDDLNYNNDNCRANTEINTDARPEIQPLKNDVSQYDTILVGYPIWWGQCPPVVRTFLESYDFTGKTVMPFCTSGSSPISGSLEKVRTLASNSIVTEGFRGTGSTTEIQIQKWLDDNGFVKEENMTDNAQNNTLLIQVGDTTLTATLADNSSAAALRELLLQKPLTIDMHDYSSFEKVGEIGTELPTNDEQITTEAGDLILYQGKSFVIYYDTNSYSFTRLGRIENTTQAELKELLGSGNVTVTLSVK